MFTGWGTKNINQFLSKNKKNAIKILKILRIQRVLGKFRNMMKQKSQVAARSCVLT